MTAFDLASISARDIIITGASRGLGAETAVELAKLGARLLLVARDEKQLLQLRDTLNNPERHQLCSADLTVTADRERAIAEIQGFNAEPDVVLHCIGGGLGIHAPVVTGEELSRVFALNVAVPAEINAHLLPRMIARKRGTIIHVGSIASTEAHGSIPYNTAKAALAAYVRSAGRIAAKSDVVITGILPGGYLAAGNAMERLREGNPQEFQKYLAEKPPRGRLGSAREVIALLLFLCSDMATMMGGCMLPIDAGEGRSFLRES